MLLIALLIASAEPPQVPETTPAPPLAESDSIDAAPKLPLERDAAIKEAVRKVIKEDKDEAKSKIPDFSSTPYGKLDGAFEEAKVPGCLRPDGLKRQSTFIFGGLLALPFILVAAVRGKCN